MAQASNSEKTRKRAYNHRIMEHPQPRRKRRGYYRCAGKDRKRP
jgi:hypothetical protein